MDNTVQIIPDEMGNVIRVSKNNPAYGHVRLQQERVTFTNTGWVSRKTISALLHGLVEDLHDTGISQMTSLSGKIVVHESLDPFNANNPDRDLKIAGETGIICCQDGQPIYRKTSYTPDVNAEDILVAHNNGDAIREANASAEVIVETPMQSKKSKSSQVDLEDSIEEVKAEESEEVEVEDSTFEL